MGDIIPFEFEGVSVRVVDQKDDLWWVVLDVCRALDIAQTGTAILRLDNDEKSILQVMDNGRPMQLTLISEPGLYKLIMTSRKPAAKRFDRWVRHEVLPSIRKTGHYRMPGIEQQHASVAFVKEVWEEQTKLIGVQFSTQREAIQRVELAVVDNTAEIVRLHKKVDGLAPRRMFFSKKIQDQYAVTCARKFDGKCGCGCGREIMKKDPGSLFSERMIDEEVYVIDHLNGRHRRGPRDGIPVYKLCNQEFEKNPSSRERMVHRAAIFHEEREKLFPESLVARSG